MAIHLKKMIKEAAEHKLKPGKISNALKKSSQLSIRIH